MADFKVPNLCGASPQFNAIQNKFESMITSAIDGLESDAAALKTTLDGDVNALVGDIKAMIPDLPALPDVNLQAELTSLSGMDVGSLQHTALLAEIKTKFGDALDTAGFALDTLVSDAAAAIGGGESLCSSVPNFAVPAAGGDAVQKAVGVLQAAADAEEEKPSVQIENPNVTASKDKAEASFKKYFRDAAVTDQIPKEKVGALNPTTKSRTITGGVGKVEIKSNATTAKDAVTKKNGKIERSNVSDKGFSNRVLTFSRFHVPNKYGNRLTMLGELFPAYFPRVVGFISTKGMTEKDVTLTKSTKLYPGYAQSDIDRGYATKYIFPDGHPASYGLEWTVKSGEHKGKHLKKQAGAEEGKKITDTYIINPIANIGSYKAHEIVLVGSGKPAGITYSGGAPTLYDYSEGDQNLRTGDSSLFGKPYYITFYYSYKRLSLLDSDSKADE